MTYQHAVMRLRRSLLATPGNVPAKVEKALQLPVDVLMLDLEDGVPDTDSAKARARETLFEALSSDREIAPREVAIRINGPRSRWFLDDLQFISTLKIPTIVVPMLRDESDMVFVERSLSAVDAPSRLGVILLIETPSAVLNLPEIVKASSRVNGLICGGLDYAAEMRSLSILPLANAASGGREDDDLIYMRQRTLAVGRAHDLSVLDAMRPSVVSDLEAFRADAKRARWLGFDGIDFFHPAYVEIANDVFSPSRQELDWAQKVISATASRSKEATASIMLDGRVILPQHMEIAQRLIAQDSAIHAR